MKLKNVKIENFRNISKANYDLEKTNIFYGPNAKGKTNTILAIYWALSDYLMDGTSDYPSFKPHSNLSDVVSVELTFKDFTLKKTYAEKWVKTRGSSEVTLQGHETQYFIDDVKYNIGEGKKLLLEKLGLSDIKENKKIDIIRSIIDPYYLAQTVPWKDLRTFIIDLVGDVDDQTVLNSKPTFEPIRNDLEKHKYDVSTLTKFYKQQIKNINEEIERAEHQILGFESVEDVDEFELGKAEAQITLIQNDIEDLKVRKKTQVNPKVAELEKQISEVREQALNSRQEDSKELQKQNQETNEKIESLVKENKQLQEQLDSLKSVQKQYDDEFHEYEQTLKSHQSDLEFATKTYERLIGDYDIIIEESYQPNASVESCPHCGGVLNQDYLDQHKIYWEEKHQQRLDSVIADGKKAKLELDNINLKIKELKKPEKTVDNSTEIKDLENKLDSNSSELSRLRTNLVFEYESKKTKELIAQGVELKKQLDAELELKQDDEIDNLIADKSNEMIKHEEIVNQHKVYLSVQKQAERVRGELSINQSSLTDMETKLMLLEDFMRTKLSLLKGNVAKVFGELEFVLIESNIKEGSFNEVCYPLILGKQTPFTSGSGAERIITGVHIIESVKKALSAPDLPIIFDEADKLDTQTLANKLVTNSQIISTKVDDINYEKVTLEAK